MSLSAGPLLVFTPAFDEAAVFYGDTLGLRLSARFPDQLVFDLAGAALHVFRCTHPIDPEHGETAGAVITFMAPDLEAAMARLREKGVRFLHSAPALNAEARLRYAAFVAPGGVIHELAERY